MSHGTPDWGRTAGLATTFQLTDMAELAARQLSVVTFDRRGDVVHLDDFESTTVKLATQTLGAGASVARDTTRARNGDASVTHTSGGAANGFAGWHKHLYLPVRSKIGVELSLAWDAITENYVDLEMQLYDGTNLTRPWVRFHQVDDEVQYRNSAGTFVKIDDFIAYQNTRRFLPVKLVADLSEGEYVRLLLADTEYDLSDIDAQQSADASNARLDVRFRITTTENAAKSIFADDLIITQNEP